MEPADVLFARNIRYLRELCGFSLTKMAKMTGISYKLLKSIENGGYAGNIKLSQLKKIYKNFGVPCSDMVDEHPEMIKKIYETRNMDTQERIDYILAKNKKLKSAACCGFLP